MPLSRADAAHLLRRTGFGATPAGISELTGMELEAAVERVLDDSRNPPAPTPDFLADPAVEQWPKQWRAVHWWMDRMRTVPTPIVEKMTLFWHGLFPSAQSKVYDMELLFRQNQTYRSLGMGDHRALVQAMAIEPAMLQYLDNESNRVGREQENFGREVMELFTMGAGTHTEGDVIAMAKAWTGHNLSADGRTYLFRPTRHDTSLKTLFGITKDWDGPEALTEILEGSQRTVSSRYLVTRLWTFLAYARPDAALVAELADGFLADGHDIKGLLRAMLLRPEFFSQQAKQGLVRSPVEWLVAGMQAMDLSAAEAHPEWFLERLGHNLFDPPNVAGWKGNEAWISTAGVWGRAAWGDYVRWKVRDAGFLRGSELLSPAAAIQRAFDAFGLVDPSPVTRAALETWFAGEKPLSRRWSITANLPWLVLLTPDFQLA